MINGAKDKLRELPSVDAVLQQPAAFPLIESSGHTVATNAVRSAIESLRSAILKGNDVEVSELTAESV
jgi:hypothetical protein